MQELNRTQEQRLRRFLFLSITIGAVVIILFLGAKLAPFFEDFQRIPKEFSIDEPRQLDAQQEETMVSGLLRCSDRTPLNKLDVKVYVQCDTQSRWQLSDISAQCHALIWHGGWSIGEGCINFDKNYDSFTLVAVLVEADKSAFLPPSIDAPDTTVLKGKVQSYLYEKDLICISPPQTVKRRAASDAVVEAELLNLRFGPGTVYDILGILKRGDTLKITGKCPAGDWLRVIAPNGQEGWVETQFLKINLPLAEVTPAPIPSTPTPISPTDMPTTPTIAPTSMPSPTNTPTDTAMPTATPTSTPHPGLALVSPDEGTSFTKGEEVKLQWKWEQDLAENEYFEVRIRLEGEQEFDQIDLTTELYRIVSASELTQAGMYEWQVAIVLLSEEEKGVSRTWSFEVQ
jgi:uncharacterized protein YraI